MALDEQGLPALLMRSREGDLEMLQLTDERAEVTLGRHSRSGLSIEWDLEVSRTHALVERVGRSWFVVDDGLSSNGTYVNGSRLDGRHRLVDGDEIRIGATLVGFRHRRAASVASTVRATGTITADMLTPMQRVVLRELCRPYKTSSSYVAPASNQQIADRLHLSVEAVKTHMRGLFERLGVDPAAPPGQKRAHVVELAFESGLVRRAAL
jgi:DNA-binding CsgD family transcriptional regulator